MFSSFFSSGSECEVFSLKMFALKWILFLFALSSRQANAIAPWLADDDEDELDDESSNANNIGC